MSLINLAPSLQSNSLIDISLKLQFSKGEKPDVSGSKDALYIGDSKDVTLLGNQVVGRTVLERNEEVRLIDNKFNK